MSLPAELLVLCSLNFIALLSPGPCFALVMRESLNISRTSGLYLAFGLALGGFFNQIIMLVGVGLLVSQSPSLLQGLKIVGAIYLAHLGLEALGLNAVNWLRQLTPGKKLSSEEEALRSVIGSKEEISAKSLKKRSFLSVIQRGVFLNMSNPGSLLFFLSIYSTAVSPHTSSVAQLGYASLLSSMDFAVFGVTAWVFSAARMQSFFFSWQHSIEKLTGLTLLGFAINLFWGS